ncbi:MAG TPA: SDR family NAD(P)-dependent oxidoreductase [Candidatus Binataceae bacterium]|nr:SDR family NAD(P)-dependent oxidoreductase [Candidatus Binataceae bacterium]
MRLASKIALITGAGSGIGRATAKLFAAEGARIAAVDIVEDAAAAAAREINEGGGKAIALRCDMSRGPDVQAMVAATVERLGAPDVVFNNAGIEGKSAFLAEMDEEAFDQVIAVNLRGVFLGMKYTLPHMISKGGGSIINTASVAAMIAVRGAVAYCAAKAAVIAMTRVAATEYGRYNIRVNCICPGVIATEMMRRIVDGDMSPQAVRRISKLGRTGKPEDIARAALFLASDESTFATGAPFVIDGGWTIT